MSRQASNSMAITALKLTKRYGDVTALDGIDLELPSRSIIGLVGPNGAGKSTLLRLILGLSQPTSGRLSVLGLDTRTRPLQIRCCTGYLMQKPTFDPWMSVQAVTELAALLSHASINSAKQMIEQVGLSHKINQSVGTLSGGELQRLGLATAMIHQPDLLILDEPAASLDPKGRHDILKLIQSFKSTGTTILFSSHLLDDVERVADYIVVLNNGAVVRVGTKTSVLSHKDLESVFLGVTAS